MFSPVFLSYISPMCQNACFSLIFPEKSAFRNGFELRRSDVKKDFFFNIFRRRSVESSSDNFRFFPINTVSCDIYQKTRNQFDSNVTWVRIPHPAPAASRRAQASCEFARCFFVCGAAMKHIFFVTYFQSAVPPPGTVFVMRCFFICGTKMRCSFFSTASRYCGKYRKS